MSDWLPLPTERLCYKNFHGEFLLLRRQHIASTPVHSALDHSALGQDTAALSTLGQRIYDHKFTFVDEVIATEVEICLRLNQHFRELDHSMAIGMLCEALKQTRAGAAPRDWCLPVHFSAANGGAVVDGAPADEAAESDWRLVEQSSGLSRGQVIERLLELEFQLAMFGFLPGFAYLSGLPGELHIPRKDTPTTVTPANSLALGGKYLGIYSLPSPAGWNVIGKLGARLMQLDKLPPIAMRPGDRVRLEQIDEEQLQAMNSSGLTLAEYNSHP